MTRKTVHDLVAEARRDLEELTVDELASELESDASVVVDIRDVRELWREGTIAGARHAPRGVLEFWADPTSPYHRPFFDPAQRVVLYCAGGQRSALAAATLKAIGYTDVAHLAGGFSAWQAADQPCAPVDPPPAVSGEGDDEAE